MVANQPFGHLLIKRECIVTSEPMKVLQPTSTAMPVMKRTALVCPRTTRHTRVKSLQLDSCENLHDGTNSAPTCLLVCTSPRGGTDHKHARSDLSHAFTANRLRSARLSLFIELKDFSKSCTRRHLIFIRTKPSTLVGCSETSKRYRTRPLCTVEK